MTSGRGALNGSLRAHHLYGVRVLTAPSRIYDYYNPEARTVVPPTRFVIR